MALFFLIHPNTFSGVVAPAVASPAGQVFSDSLLPSAARPSGAAVQGTALTEGGVKWNANKGVTISDKGATSSVPGGADHLIDNSVAGTIHLRADVDAHGSGFTGIALGRNNLSGNFWASVSLLFYVSGDRYNLQVESKDVIADVDKSILHTDGSNALDLSVDTVKRTVTAKINDKVVLNDFPLPTSVELADITSAGFRFNEPVTAGSPSVSNYHAEVSTKGKMKLTPVDLSTFFLTPDKEVKLNWRVGNPDPATSLAYVVRDYEGHQTGSGSGVLSGDGIVTVTKAFPRGYSEIYFPAADQTYGLVSLDPHAGPADPFFCMDSALSGLEQNPDRQASLIKSLARSGIAMSRERTGPDGVRNMYAENKVQILEILDGNLENLPELAPIL